MVAVLDWELLVSAEGLLALLLIQLELHDLNFCQKYG
jgi:hypothetical protein